MISAPEGQQAQYLFKLRRNIVLEGDLLLARLELAALLGVAPAPVADLHAFSQRYATAVALIPGAAAPGQDLRPLGCQGYCAVAPLALLPTLVRRLSFVQHIYCFIPGLLAPDLLCDLRASVGPVVDGVAADDCVALYAVPHAALLELADTVVRRATGAAETKHNLDLLPGALLGRPATAQAARLAATALDAKSSTAHLSHDIHYYKAKFFPRLARAMLNVGAGTTGAASQLVLDNFAGSGTTLLEASLLGIRSVGLDLDPLSVLVARTKLDALQLDSATLAAESARIGAGMTARTDDAGDGTIDFPAWLLKNRKMTAAIAAQLNSELAVVRRAVAGGDPAARNLLRVLLSDAISRKLRMRFLGTGVGRFSLTFRATPLADTFARALLRYVKVAALGEWLRDTLHIAPAPGAMLTADARAVPCADNSFDLLLTSPPYLPASSGRESYTRARALSLIALGMRDGSSVDDLDGDTIGSMNPLALHETDLAPGEQDLVDWLGRDELRGPKAVPTARYFADMRRAFAEMHRVLRPGALAVVVSGKQSTFYRFSTREPLYVARSAELLADAAAASGFTVEALHDLQLQKSNMNARPRSLDDYYETLIMLRKTEGGPSTNTARINE